MSSKHPSQSEINDLIDLFSNNSFKEALIEINNIETIYPSEPIIKNIKGACFEGLEQLDEAIKSYKEAISIDSKNFKAYFNIARVMEQLDRFEDALDFYKKSLKINSKFAEAHNNLGNLMREMSFLDEARKSFETAISLKPEYVEALFSLSLIFQELGLLHEEVECLNKVTKLKPKFINAFNNLGVALKGLNNFSDAIEAFKRAIKINPNFAEVHNNLGNTYKELGKLEEAISCYELAINSDAVYPVYFNNLGIVLTELKQFDRATLTFQSSLDINPDYPDTHNYLGNLLKEQGRFDEASGRYKKALSIDPNNFDAHNNLGNTQRELDLVDDAIRSYENAIEINQFFPEAHNNLGSILKEIKRYDDALNNYQKAIQLNPNYVECLNNFGVIFFELGESDKALEYYQKALEINPDYAYTWGNIGIVYFNKFDIVNSIKFYKKAISLDPLMIEAHLNLGICFKIKGEFNDALNSYASAISINPDADFLLGSTLNTMMLLCSWAEVIDRTNEIKNKIDNSELVMLPFEFMALTDDPLRLKKITQIYAEKNYPRLDTLPKLEIYPAHKRIKLGYFSADFRSHPVTTLTAQLYEMHDRKRFEVHAFSFGRNTNDDMNLRIRKGVDYYHDVVDSSDKDIALLSRSLEIDIAIDLGGFTEGCRTKIFAMSAAPIQLSYIGYLGTLGTDYYDYLIADEIIIPKENQKHYSEKIIYLPSFQVNDSIKPKIKNQIKRKDFGLPDKNFIFCCFNNTFKITPNVFNSWSRILSKVDDSLLMIFVENPSSRSNLLTEMQKRGVKADRLIFADKLSRIEFLERNTVVDLFLDTFPYNAATTASDSLRMGLPVLTLSGSSFASRVGASLLTAVGMPELITNDQDDYESVAVDLASNPNKMNSIKKKLARNLENAPLFNTKDFTLQIEKSYAEIYEKNKLGLEPDHIYIKA